MKFVEEKFVLCFWTKQSLELSAYLTQKTSLDHNLFGPLECFSTQLFGNVGSPFFYFIQEKEGFNLFVVSFCVKPSAIEVDVVVWLTLGCDNFKFFLVHSQSILDQLRWLTLAIIIYTFPLNLIDILVIELINWSLNYLDLFNFVWLTWCDLLALINLTNSICWI